MSEWKNAEQEKPAYSGGFVWIYHHPHSGLATVELAYWNGSRFQFPETAGDREGLHVEYFEDVESWAEMEEPKHA